jgi:hypothetical protein
MKTSAKISPSDIKTKCFDIKLQNSFEEPSLLAQFEANEPVISRKKRKIKRYIVDRMSKCNFTPAEHRRMMWFIMLLEKNKEQVGMGPFNYYQLPTTYITKCLGKHYYRAMAKAIDGGLIERHEKYLPSTFSERGFCKAYRINPTINKGELVEVEFGKQHVKTFIEHSSDLVIAKMKMDKEMANNILSGYITMERYMEKVTEPKEMDGAMKTFFPGQRNGRMVSMAYAKSFAEMHNMNLFKKGKKLYIANRGEFKGMLEIEVKKSWEWSIENGLSGNSERGMNGRLFSSICTIPGKLWEAITLNGSKVVATDLKNSQMRILSGRIKKWEEEERRIEGEKENSGGRCSSLSLEAICVDGKIYDKMVEMGYFDTRDAAKVGVLKAMYSSHRVNSKVKDFFRQEFPGIMERIDAYKKKNGKASLANLMQQAESDVFIDKILHQLYCMGIDAVSKHDSILCAEPDMPIVEAVVNAILEEHIGKCTLSTKMAWEK